MDGFTYSAFIQQSPQFKYLVIFSLILLSCHQHRVHRAMKCYLYSKTQMLLTLHLWKPCGLKWDYCFEARWRCLTPYMCVCVCVCARTHMRYGLKWYFLCTACWSWWRKTLGETCTYVWPFPPWATPRTDCPESFYPKLWRPLQRSVSSFSFFLQSSPACHSQQTNISKSSTTIQRNRPTNLSLSL
jgi:hypothetical protein